MRKIAQRLHAQAFQKIGGLFKVAAASANGKQVSLARRTESSRYTTLPLCVRHAVPRSPVSSPWLQCGRYGRDAPAQGSESARCEMRFAGHAAGSLAFELLSTQLGRKPGQSGTSASSTPSAKYIASL
eukprot:2694706-Pleurochrysis_carterae.AAC.1